MNGNNKQIGKTDFTIKFLIVLNKNKNKIKMPPKKQQIAIVNVPKNVTVNQPMYCAFDSNGQVQCEKFYKQPKNNKNK